MVPATKGSDSEVRWPQHQRSVCPVALLLRARRRGHGVGFFRRGSDRKGVRRGRGMGRGTAACDVSMLVWRVDSSCSRLRQGRIRIQLISFPHKIWRACWTSVIRRFGGIRLHVLTLSPAVQVIGWHSSGTIVFNDVSCTQNLASGSGGCFFSTGRSIFNNGAVMHDNKARDGGCICESYR